MKIRIKHFLILIMIALQPVMTLQAESALDEKVLYEFKDDPTDFQWYALNDTVMGGRSKSGMAMAGEDVIAFYGDVSLENNGGFASVRSASFLFGIDNYDGIRLRVRGDGKTYKLRLQTNARSSLSYEHNFETKAGVWTEVNLDFDDFRLVYFGRTVRDAPQLNPEDIRNFGLMISDKQVGEFRIEIDRISAYKMDLGFGLNTSI